MGIRIQMALALSHCQPKFCLLGTEPYPYLYPYPQL